MLSLDKYKKHKEERKEEKNLLKQEKQRQKQKEKTQLSLTAKKQPKPKAIVKGKTTKPKKKKTKTATKKLKAILLDLVMIYWKIKHTDNNGVWKCCTCGLVWVWTTMQWWHFIPQSKGLATKFEPDNINLQCAGCNWKANQWEQYKHWLYIDSVYGEGRADELHQQAQKPKQWKVWELEEAIESVENKILWLCNYHWIARTALIVWYIVKDSSRKSNCKSLLAKIANETS